MKRAEKEVFAGSAAHEEIRKGDRREKKTGDFSCYLAVYKISRLMVL